MLQARVGPARSTANCSGCHAINYGDSSVRRNVSRKELFALTYRPEGGNMTQEVNFCRNCLAEMGRAISEGLDKEVANA